ncbi:MAG: hypothetical protein ACRBHB_22740 [Arenicella sp.]
MNSLIIIVAFIAFISFGYIALIGWFARPYKRQKIAFDTNSDSLLRHRLRQLLTIKPDYLVFILIAVTIALHWGWAPAILLLFMGCIFINFTTHTLLSFYSQQSTTQFPKGFFLHSNKRQRQFTLAFLFTFAIFVCSLLIMITSELLNKYSGILIGIIFLLLALSVKRASPGWSGNIIALCIAACGAMIADHLGLYLLGNWQPFKWLPAFVIDDRLLFCCLILFILWKVESEQKTEKHSLVSQFTNLSTLLSALTTGSALLFIIIQRPLLDAPVHVETTTIPHYLLLLMLVMSFGAINLLQCLFQIVGLDRNSNLDSAVSNNNNGLDRSHGGVLYEVITAAILLCLIASSNGIGAWSSHFASWDPTDTLQDILGLGIQVLATTLSPIGLAESSAKTLIAFVLAMNCFSALFKLSELIHRLGLPLIDASILNKEQSNQPLSNNPLLNQPLLKNTPEPEQHYSLSYYLISGLILVLLAKGLTINTWLLFGGLSICCLSLIMLDNCHRLLKTTDNNPLFLAVTTLLSTVGVVQLTAQIIFWWQDQELVYVIAAGLLLTLYLWLLFYHYRILYTKIRLERNKNPLDF